MDSEKFISNFDQLLIDRDTIVAKELVSFHADVRQITFDSAKNNIKLLPLVQLKEEVILTAMQKYHHLKYNTIETEVKIALQDITNDVTLRSHRQGDYFNIGLQKLEKSHYE